MAETFTTKEDWLKRAQEIAKDGIERWEITSLKEVLTKLFQIPDIKFSDDELAILKSIKEQVTAIRDESNTQRDELANELRGNIISQTIKSKGEANLDLVTLWTKNEKIEWVKIVLIAEIVKTLKQRWIDLPINQIENVAIGISARILKGDIMSILWWVASTGLYEMWKISKESVVQKATEYFWPMLGLPWAKVEESTPTTIKDRLIQLVATQIEPILALIEKNKADLSVLDWFLSNPEAISTYQDGMDVTKIEKPTKEELEKFIVWLNDEILKLDKKAWSLEELKDTALDVIVKLWPLAETFAKPFLEWILSIPILWQIIASLLWYTSKETALDGLFGKELKRKKSIIVFITEAKEGKLPLLKDKKLDSLKPKQFEQLFDFCDKHKIDYSTWDFWKKLINGVPNPTWSESLSPQDTILQMLSKELKLDGKDFSASWELFPTFFSKIWAAVATIERKQTEVQIQKPQVDMKAKIAELETRATPLRNEKTQLTDLRGKANEVKKASTEFNHSDIDVTWSDLTEFRKIKLSAIISSQIDWYKVVEKAVDWMLEYFYADSVRIKPSVEKLRNLIISLKNKDNFPDQKIFTEIFWGRNLDDITTWELFDKLDTIRWTISKYLDDIDWKIEQNSKLLWPIEKELEWLGISMKEEIVTEWRKWEILNALSSWTIEVKGKIVTIDIWGNKKMVIDLEKQEISIPWTDGKIRTLKIKVEGNVIVTGIHSIRKDERGDIRLQFSTFLWREIPELSWWVKTLSPATFLGLIYDLETKWSYTYETEDKSWRIVIWA